jgi:RNA polymerase sigma-70 factor, ECF subfamily
MTYRQDEQPCQVEQQFNEFVDASQRKLLGFLRKMGLSIPDAEEALNDSFLATWKHWHRIRDTKPLYYLYVVARNEVYARWKARRGRPEDLMSEPPAAKTGDFAQQVIDRQTVRRALSELTEREREAVLLRYYVGFNVSETAAIMDGISPGAVQRYASDGRQKLNRALGGADTGEGGS